MQYKKLLLLISCGAVLEYYDFAIFVYLAPYIGKSLIPVNNPVVNLILSFAIFAIGAFFRPIGGLIFGHIGDTRGRNNSFTYTLLFMAVPTLSIAFIPDIQHIGILATLLLLLFRICQGVAVGGEVPGSIVFGYEIATAKYKALSSSIVILGTNVGFVLASIICTMLLSLPEFTLANWRLAFILGGILGIVSYGLRKKLTETSAFLEYKKSLMQEAAPIKILFKQHSKTTLQMVSIGSFFAALVAVFTFYMPTYLVTFYHFPIATIMQFNSYTIIIFICGSLIAGLFDKWLGKRFFIGAFLLLTIAITILFQFYAILSLGQVLLIHVFLLFIIGLICGRFPVIVASAFPVAVRYSGVACTYNISFGIVAGSTQMVLSWLIKMTGLLWIPALYLLFFSIIAFIAVLSVQAKQFTDYVHCL